jgi:hypothetical protein
MASQYSYVKKYLESFCVKISLDNLSFINVSTMKSKLTTYLSTSYYEWKDVKVQ